MIFKMKKLNHLYLGREVDNELLKWKEDTSRKPLLIRGARQVGKSTAVRQLAKTFRYFIEINFEKNENLRKVFDGDLDPQKLIEQIRYFHLVGGMPVTHTSANGQPLGAEINEKFRKYIFIDTGLLLRLHHFQTEDILLAPPSDFVNKGNLAEMFVGLELIKYSNPYEKAELFYWQREEKNTQAEVDYVIIRNGIPAPVEVKAGKRGTLQSLYIFLKK